MTAPLLGVIADDLTGACDAAEAIAQAGLSTLVLLGVPAADAPADADCVVIALKSRTIDPDDAVAMSSAAAAWLLGRHTRTIYQKYCSTFDSTDRGNIGPVSDALARELDRHSDGVRGPGLLSVGTPATPAVGRTQYLGHLFVGGQLLAESSLRHHPLTPMTESNLVRVLGAQTPNPVTLLDLSVVRSGTSAVRAELASLARRGASHVLVDVVNDDDLDVIARAVTGDSGGAPLLLTGAAGLAGAVARTLAEKPTERGSRSRARQPATLPPGSRGPRLILSGSASTASREQAAAFPGPVVTFDPLEIARGRLTVDHLHEMLADAFTVAAGSPVLIAPDGAADPNGTDRLREVQDALGTDASARVVEDTLSAVASRAVGELGVRALIVAGGETSGAVAAALGIESLRLGKSAARGVPWMVAHTSQGVAVAILLKSGNFGQADLFTTAWEAAP